MTEQTPQLPPFPQPDFNEVPAWDPKAKFQISGAQFEAIYAFLNMFNPAIQAVNMIFQRHVQNGTIQFNYLDEAGVPVSEEKVEDYRAAVKEYMELRVKVMNTPLEPVEDKKPELEIVSR